MAAAAGVDMISFWPTNNPYYGYSFRYRLGLLNDIGVKNWKGRELDLRKEGSTPKPKASGNLQAASPKGA
jgi:hypothetical protein